MKGSNKAQPSKTEPASVRLTRRETMQYGGTSAAMLGSPLSLFPDFRPRLQYLWMRVRSSGETDFVAKFESDVESAFWAPFVSREKIERIASQGELTLDLRPVDFDPARDVPDKRTLTGQVSGFISKQSTPADTVYSADSIAADAEEINSQFPVFNPVSKVKPRGGGPFIEIEFPDGYMYQLPPPGVISGAVDEYRRSGFLGNGDSKPPVPFNGSPLDYPIEDRYLSVPSITHRSDSNLAWLQSVAQMKYELLELPGIDHTLRDMYRPTWYGTRAVEKAFEIARHIGKELGKAAIEEVLLYKAPTAFTATKDVADIAAALQPGYVVPESDTADDSTDGSDSGGFIGTITDIFTGGGASSTPDVPDEFEKATELADNAIWMRKVVHPDYEPTEVQASGLNSLFVTTMFERAWNHMYASTADSDELEQLKTLYVRTLEQQQQIARQTQANILEEAPSLPDQPEYWTDLYQHALNICTEFDTVASSQLEVLDSN